MIPLAAPLDTIRFDDLVEIARSRLPSHAPDWTDYNFSDPGITLVELLSWVADTQIYAIGRNRRDERQAMAALLGVAVRGATPASGTVYPASTEPLWQEIANATVLTPIGGAAPRLETSHPLALQPVEIERIVAEGSNGPVDLTATNRQARAAFAPFGPGPSAAAALRLVFTGEVKGDPPVLSIGFELEDADRRTSKALGTIDLFYVGEDDKEVKVVAKPDLTDNLQRSGAMVVTLPKSARDRDRHVLVLRPGVNAALNPTIVRIAPNALPVVQRASLDVERVPGTGRVGQTLTIEPIGLFRSDEAVDNHAWRLMERDDGLSLDVDVEVGDQADWRWRRCADFRDAGPEDRIYVLTEYPEAGQIEIRFGNGVNGARPPRGAPIAVRLQMSAGVSGNVSFELDWKLDGQTGRWQNRGPIGGGVEASDLDDLLERLRRRLRSDRTLATSEQIVEAVKALPESFGVDRAWIEEGWEPGRRRPAAPATRTLLVTRERAQAETESWRRAIGRSVRPRIALGERLVVATPAWQRLRVRVGVVAAPGRSPPAIEEDVRRELADRLTPGGEKGRAWPLGRDVSGVAVGGWIRRLAGVADVASLALLDEAGRPLPDNRLTVGRGELPLLVAEVEDVVAVAVAVAGGRP